MELNQLCELELAKLVPKASYALEVNLQAKSYVAEHQEVQNYQFYRKNQVEWLQQIQGDNITTENAARRYFEIQYNLAIREFLVTNLGQQIVVLYPQTQWNLSELNETWEHFLNGTYGLCTRTGMPNEIFLKHLYIGFIEFMVQQHQPDCIKPEPLEILSRAVVALDKVVSDFAPHEVAQSSRQRCIINIKKDYLI